MPQELLMKFGHGIAEDHGGRSFTPSARSPISENVRLAIMERPRTACHLCRMHPGLSERMFLLYGRWFHAGCHAKFRKFMKSLRTTVKNWQGLGLTWLLRRENYKQSIQTAKALAA